MTIILSEKNRLCLSILPLSSAIISLSLFISGVAEYRYFLVNAISMIVIAVATYLQVSTKFLKNVMAISLIVSVYYDITNGPIRVSSYNLNLFIAILLDFVVSGFLNKHIKHFVERYSDHKVFSICPNCLFDSNDIATKCSECGFDSNIDTFNNNLTNKLSLLEILQINADENIKKIIKTGGLLAKNTIYMNDIKIFASHLIITDKRIIIARIRKFKRGWSYKKSIQISSVKSAIIEPKKYIGKSMNSIRIELMDDSYLNIYFVRFGSNDRENIELLNYLKWARQQNL